MSLSEKKAKRRTSWNSKEGKLLEHPSPSRNAPVPPVPPESGVEGKSAMKKERRKSWGFNTGSVVKSRSGATTPTKDSASAISKEKGSDGVALAKLVGTLDAALARSVYVRPSDPLLASALDLLVGAMQQPIKGVSVKDRKSFFKTYRACFVGNKAVDWLAHRLKVDRERAKELAQSLIDHGCIVSASGSSRDRFQDDRAFYQFTFAAPVPTDRELDVLLDGAVDVILVGEEGMETPESSRSTLDTPAGDGRQSPALGTTPTEFDGPEGIIPASGSAPALLSTGASATNLEMGFGELRPRKGSRGKCGEAQSPAENQRRSSLANSTNTTANLSTNSLPIAKVIAQKKEKEKALANTKGKGGKRDNHLASSTLPDLEDLKFELVDGACKVRLGSVLRLTEMLIASPTIDTPYRDAFLLTYRTFTTPEELFDVLTHCWQDAQDSDDPAASRSVEQRTITFMKAWFEKWPEDILPIADVIADFIKQNLAEKYGVLAARLLKFVEPSSTDSPILARHQRRHYRTDLTSGFPVEPTEETFMSWNNTEVAQQLALYNHSLYLRIQEHELMSQGWSKKNADELAPNVLACIAAFNRLSWLVMTDIVSHVFLKDRVASVQKYIDLATQLSAIHDYSGCMAIYSALNSAPIQRLKKTWEALAPDVKDKMSQLNDLLSHNKNYTALRSAIKGTTPPLIPYLGVFLQDLTFIEEIPTKIGELVNFAKCWKLATTVSDVLEYQQSIYSFEVNPKIMSWLVNTPVKREEEIYSISLKVEPRDLEQAIQQMMEQEKLYKQQVQQLEVQVDELTKTIKEQASTEEGLRSSNRNATQLLTKAREVLESVTIHLNPEQLQVLEAISWFFDANALQSPVLKLIAASQSRSFSRTPRSESVPRISLSPSPSLTDVPPSLEPKTPHSTDVTPRTLWDEPAKELLLADEATTTESPRPCEQPLSWLQEPSSSLDEPLASSASLASTTESSEPTPQPSPPTNPPEQPKDPSVASSPEETKTENDRDSC